MWLRKQLRLFFNSWIWSCWWQDWSPVSPEKSTPANSKQTSNNFLRTFQTIASGTQDATARLDQSECLRVWILLEIEHWFRTLYRKFNGVAVAPTLSFKHKSSKLRYVLIWGSGYSHTLLTVNFDQLWVLRTSANRNYISIMFWNVVKRLRGVVEGLKLIKHRSWKRYHCQTSSKPHLC